MEVFQQRRDLFEIELLRAKARTGSNCGSVSLCDKHRELRVNYPEGRLRLLIRSLAKSNSSQSSINDSKATL